MFTKLKERYRESLIILRELVKTDFLLRYQGSFLGIAWSVLKPLMLFCVMYVVFVKFLRFSDGTDTFPLVLLLGISMWNFFTESTDVYKRQDYNNFLNSDAKLQSLGIADARGIANYYGLSYAEGTVYRLSLIHI